MRLAALSLWCFSILGCASTSLVGSTIPPTPAGLLHRQGACVAHALGNERICEYSVGILEDSKGKPEMFFGARMAGRDKSRKAHWIITDAFPYPTLPERYFLAVATCRVAGKDDSTIIAAVRGVDAEWFRDVLWARRFDLTTGKFVEINTSGVECSNESWEL